MNLIDFQNKVNAKTCRLNLPILKLFSVLVVNEHPNSLVSEKITIFTP